MTPEEYTENKSIEIMDMLNQFGTKGALIAILCRNKLIDTWNEALKQAESVLPEEKEQILGVALSAIGHNTCREQSLQAIDTLKLK